MIAFVFQMVRLLLCNGALVNPADKRDRRPLHWAAFRGHDDCVRELIRSEADVNAKDREGFTPLHAAAASGSDLVVQLLLMEGADVAATNKVRKRDLL